MTKSILILLGAVLSLLSGKAQPILDSTYFPKVGIAYESRYVFVNYAVISPMEGVNMLWDYTTVDTTIYGITKNVIFVKGADDSPFSAAHFPQANYTLTTGGQFWLYYRKDHTGLYSFGVSNPDSSINRWPHPIQVVPSPFSYGQETWDTITYPNTSIQGPSNWRRTVTRMKYVGTGTLKVRGGTTHTNTILLRTIDSTYTIYAGSIRLTDVSQSWRWLSIEGAGSAVGQVAGSMDLTRSNPRYISGFNWVNGIYPFSNQAPYRPAASTNLWPNPAHDRITVSAEALFGQHGRILNNVGQQVHFFTVSGQETSLDISSLRPGLYLLTLDTPHGPVTKRFVKE